MKKYSLGSKELDELLGKIDSGSTVLVEGLPGAGKTTLALSLAYSNIIENNSSVAYMVFGETPEKLLLFSEKIGLHNIRDLVKSGKLEFIKIPIVADTQLIDYISKIISEKNCKCDIIIIDSITPLLKLLHTYKTKRAWIQGIYDYVSRMSKGLLVLVADIMCENDVDLRMLEYVSDIVLKINYEFRRHGHVERAIEVRKYRGRQVRATSIPFSISEKNGLIVLNYISEEQEKTLRSRKKPILLECKHVQKLFSTKNIKPGTQILIVDRRGWFECALINHLIYVIYGLLKKGYSIRITSFCPEVLNIVKKKVERLAKTVGEVKGKIIVREIDPIIIPPQHIASETRPVDLAREIDVLITLCLEKLFYIYGAEEVRDMTINVIEMLRKLGITTFRYMMLLGTREIPSYLIEFHDIVIEIVSKDRGETVVRVLKNLMATESIEIPEKELEYCPS